MKERERERERERGLAVLMIQPQMRKHRDLEIGPLKAGEQEREQTEQSMSGKEC